MAVKLIAAFWLLAASTHYVASTITYGQLSTKPVGRCHSLDCEDSEKGFFTCVRHRTVDGQDKSDSFKFNKELYSYKEIDANGEFNGRIMTIKDNEGVKKFTVTDKDGEIKLILCTTNAREPTKEDEAVFKDFCDDDGMKPVYQKNCSED